MPEDVCAEQSPAFNCARSSKRARYASTHQRLLMGLAQSVRGRASADLTMVVRFCDANILPAARCPAPMVL